MVYADLARSRDSRMFRDLVMKPSSFSPPVIPARHRVTRLNKGSTRPAWKRRNRARGMFCLAIWSTIDRSPWAGYLPRWIFRVPRSDISYSSSSCRGMLIEWQSISLETFVVNRWNGDDSSRWILSGSVRCLLTLKGDKSGYKE